MTIPVVAHSADVQSDIAAVVANGNGHLAKKPESSDGFGTRAIHVGSEPNAETGAVIPSISLSTTYKQDGVGIHKGYEYSRSGNPNRNALEHTLASIESGGADALAFSSGSAATATVLQSLGPDAHVVSVNDVYGGTFRYLTRVAGETQGLEATFVDLERADDDAVLDAFRSNTKLVWIESPTNPTLRLVDIPRIVALAAAHPAHPLVAVDNTFLSPYYASPLLSGADLVLHSLTKYINGHSDAVLGAVIIPAHRQVLADKLRFLQNAAGAVPSAFDCWLVQRGAKTLHLRMREHGINALKVARALARSLVVKDVKYPGLASHPRHALAYRSLSPHAKRFVDDFIASTSSSPSPLSSSSSISDLPSSVTHDFPYGGMVSFLLPTPRAALAFLRATRLFALAESLGGVESLAEAPAGMTHASVPAAARRALGIGGGLVRLSVGVEDGDDLVADVEQALQAAADALAEAGEEDEDEWGDLPTAPQGVVVNGVH